MKPTLTLIVLFFKKIKVKSIMYKNLKFVFSHFSLYTLIVLFLMFLGCQSKKEKKYSLPIGRIEEEPLPDFLSNEVKKEVVETALAYEKIKWFYIDTTVLNILNNFDTAGLADLKMFDVPVFFIDSAKIINTSIHYIKIEELSIYMDSAIVSLHYPTQGAVANLAIYYNYEKDQYKVTKDEIYEY